MMQSHARESLLFSVLLLATVPAFAQEQKDDQELAQAPAETTAAEPAKPPEEAAELGTVVVTGTRVKGRSPTQAISPIDSFGGTDFERQGNYDFTDELRNVAPSFNTQRFPIADGTAFIRPANLRNLPPDETLVLVNGHRRHRSALVNLQVEPFGTVNQGAQPVDFGLIPAGAIDRVEVLRDGASSQYGSDAIAGVINIILKDNPRGLTFASQYGSSYDGDGDNYRLSANLGLPMGAGGFFNATAEYINSDPTSRGQPRPDAAAVAAAVGQNKVPFNGLGQRWGDPFTEGFRLFFNTETSDSDLAASLPVGGTFKFYGHGSYASEDFLSSFFYRTPVGVPGVTPRGTLFVDADKDGQPDDVDQEIVDQIRAQGKDPNDFLTADSSSSSGFVALNPIASRFPGGYTPTFGADITDFEGVLGFRGDLDFGLRWDLSGRIGENDVLYRLQNSINPALGRLSPVDFKPGDLEQRELGVNLDFVYPWAIAGLASPLNVAFGAEYRRETYRIGIGDPDSFESSPTGVLFGVGSDGFQGDSPDAAGTFRNPIHGAYLDLETDIVDWLRVDAAGRLEDSRDFQSSLTGKFGVRVQPVQWLALRSTVSTGLRTPTPGQIHTEDITTTADSSGALVPLGTFPVDSPVAQALGAKPLKTEHSNNVTAGIVVTPFENFSFTADYYNIDVNKRIALANITIEPGSPEQQALIDSGIDGANLIRSVSFFSNAVDTTVQGIEIAATQRATLGEWGYAVLDARHSFNDQNVDRFVPGTIDIERVHDLEHQLPRHRSIFTVNYQSPWRIDTLLRVNRYGRWQDLTFGELGKFSSTWLVDLAATAHVLNHYHFTVGAENLFDKLPDKETNSVLRFLGATRPVSSPFGFNGGTWFLRASVDL